MDGNNFTDVTMGTSIATCGSNEKVIGRIYDFAVGGGERISNIDKTVNTSSNTIVLPSNNLSGGDGANLRASAISISTSTTWLHNSFFWAIMSYLKEKLFYLFRYKLISEYRMRISKTMIEYYSSLLLYIRLLFLHHYRYYFR